MRCEYCKGRGFSMRKDAWTHSGVSPSSPVDYTCPECGGFGEISCCEGAERLLQCGSAFKEVER